MFISRYFADRKGAPERVLRLRASRYWYLLPVVLCAVPALGAAVYCFAGYDALRAWYLQLSPCLYNAGRWPQFFFTPATKAAGHLYAAASIPVAAAAIAYFIRRFRSTREPLVLSATYARKEVAAMLALYALGGSVWLYGALTACPSYDEVFSLMNFARIHPLQTASYYVLPNNHVLFNLLNAAPAHLFRNGVMSGRIISGMVCAPLIILVYAYLRGQSRSRFFAFISVAVLMLQFVVFAFSVQARGYALFLAAAWGSLVFLDYYLRRGGQLALALHGLCIVAGFWTVPSFLLWEATLALYAFWYCLRRRRAGLSILHTHLAAGAMVYLVHLPVLLFSGKAALTDNKYVRSAGGPLSGFLRDSWYELRHLMRYAFAELPPARYECDLLLAALPLAAVLLIPGGRRIGLMRFYLLLWGFFIVAELALRHFPPFRNLTAHQSLSLAAILLALWTAIGHFLGDNARLPKMLMAGICVALAAVFVRFDYKHLQDMMYGYNLESSYRNVAGLVGRLPPGTRLGTSPESFYPRYLCLQSGISASECMGNAATMYVKRVDEPLPLMNNSLFLKVDSVEDYQVYRIVR